jgi:hypothetical protein
MEMRDSRGVNPHLSPLVYLIVTPSVAGLAIRHNKTKQTLTIRPKMTLISFWYIPLYGDQLINEADPQPKAPPDVVV